MSEKSVFKSYYCWVILLCGISLAVCNMGNATIMNIMLPFIRDSLKINNTQSTLLTTIRQLCVVGSTLVMDRYFKRFGLRVGTFIIFLCGALSSYLFSIADNYAICVAAAVLCGVTFGLGGAMPIAFLMRNWFVKGRGLMVGICAAGSGLTTAVMARPVTSIIKSGGLAAGGRLAMYIMLAGSVLFLILCRSKPSDIGTVPFGEGFASSQKAKKFRREPAKPMTSGANMMLVVLGLCIGVPGFTMLGNFTLATRTMGYDAAVVATALSLNGVIGMFGKALYGAICDLIGAVRTTLLFFCGVCGACVCLLLCNGVDTQFLYAAAVLLGFSLFPISTVGFALWSTDLADEEGYGRVLKKLQSMNVLGGLLFLTVPGIIADMTGSYKPAYFVDIACYVVATFCLLTLYRKFAGRRVKVEDAQ